ncbi:MAG: hypothetical protein LBH32_01770 [Dysgonamonadaceae bacterium]|jgi:hypothetical protein|nr:hypothetical protein [Dysgonamonadaceae bacterium]
MKDLNKKIVDKITERLVTDKKSVNYIRDVLCISKESAYRRYKSQIPFSFDEIATIATALGFSVDEIIGGDQRNRTVLDIPVDKGLQSPFGLFANKIKQEIGIMNDLLDSKNTNVIAAINRVPLYLMPFKELFKFEYFNYLYSAGQVPLMTQFSDIVIPAEIEKLHEKSVELMSRLPKLTIIVDNLFFSKIINEISYYHDLKFISDDDFRLLQGDILKFYDMCETLLRTGKNNSGANYSIYYSFLLLNFNCVYYEYDDKNMLQLYLYPEYPILINDNPMVSNIQKRWLESVIRNSTLITKSSDILKIEAFRDIYRKIKEFQ